MDVSVWYPLAVLGVPIGLAIAAGIRFARTRSVWAGALLVLVVVWFLLGVVRQYGVQDWVFYIGLAVAIIWALVPPRGSRMFLVALGLWVASTLLVVPIELLRDGSSGTAIGIELTLVLLLVSLGTGLVNGAIALFRKYRRRHTTPTTPKMAPDGGAPVHASSNSVDEPSSWWSKVLTGIAAFVGVIVGAEVSAFIAIATWHAFGPLSLLFTFEFWVLVPIWVIWRWIIGHLTGWGWPVSFDAP